MPSPFARSLLFGYVAAFMYEGDSPARRAPGRRALARPDAARRAARPRRAARAARPRRHRADRARAAAARARAQGEGRRGRRRPAAGARAAVGGGDRERGRVARRASKPSVATRLERRQAARPADAASSQRQPRHPRHDRRRRALGRRRGRRPACATPSAPRCRSACPPPSSSRSPTRSATSSPATRAPTARSPPPTSPTRFGLGTAVVLDALRGSPPSGACVEGEFRPGRDRHASGATSRCCVACAAARSPRCGTRSSRSTRRPSRGFLPAWQHVGAPLRGVDGVAQVIDQLAGVALPASAWESLVLPARVRDYSPVMLDELTLTGEVVWSGEGALPGNDGWVSLHLADRAAHPAAARAARAPPSWSSASSTRSPAAAPSSSASSRPRSAAPTTRRCSRRSGSWSGPGSSPTTPSRRCARGSGRRARRSARPARARLPRPRRPAQRSAGRRRVGGRWSLLPLRRAGEHRARQAHAPSCCSNGTASSPAAPCMSEGVRGGFALAYKVLSGFEETGRARRGYFVEGLGAAQFATGATVDRLRSFSRDGIDAAATPTSSPSPRPTRRTPTARRCRGRRVEGHRPGRKAGALVVLVDGELVLYLERGGKTALTFGADEEALALAAARPRPGRARVARQAAHRQGRRRVRHRHPARRRARGGGLRANPQGLRLRA